jgi:FAD-dependent urate hydroxylase
MFAGFRSAARSARTLHRMDATPAHYGRRVRVTKVRLIRIAASQCCRHSANSAGATVNSTCQPGWGRITRRGCKRERPVNGKIHRDDCDVAVIGAGPYGLALAAHLRDAKIATRVFGTPVGFWRDRMPKGMKLLSPWSRTHIADPHARFTLDAFARQHGFGPAADQIALERFVSYGEWFQRQAVPDHDPRKVIRVEDSGRGFCLVLEDGTPICTRSLVVAAGLAQQEFRPAPFAGLPADLVSHTGDHASLDHWRGRRVAVIGRGQGACESAALLHEAGSEVELVCRGDIRFLDAAPKNGKAPPDWRASLRKALTPASALGPLPWSWLNGMPGITHHAPSATRDLINTVSLRPAVAGWLRPRLAEVRVRAGCRIDRVTIEGNKVGLALDSGRELYDHVLLATGYKTDIGKLRMLPRELLRQVTQYDGSPVLGAGFVSTVPGLHFIGASAARSFGPLMHFIAGAGYAARSVTKAVLAHRVRQERQSLVQMDCDFLTNADGFRH